MSPTSYRTALLRDTLMKEKEWLGCKDSNLGMPGPKPGALPLGDTPTQNKRNIIQKLFKKVKSKCYHFIMENHFDPLIYERYLKKKETFLLFKKIGQMSAFNNLKLQLKQKALLNECVAQALGDLKLGFRYAKIEYKILKIYFTHPSFLKAFKTEEERYTHDLKTHFLETKQTLKALNCPLDFASVQASVKKRPYQKPVLKPSKKPVSVNVNCEGLSAFTKEQFLKLKRACNDNTPHMPPQS